jgi:hypothetical protein
MAQRGLRERLQLTSPAVGLPFDHGEFELTVEPWPSSRSRLRPASLFGAGQNDI